MRKIQIRRVSPGHWKVWAPYAAHPHMHCGSWLTAIRYADALVRGTES